MISLCEKGSEEDMLNIELIRNLKKQKEFLLIKINESLKNELIEFKDTKGKRLILNLGKLPKLLGQDKMLMPLFSNAE